MRPHARLRPGSYHLFERFRGIEILRAKRIRRRQHRGRRITAHHVRHVIRRRPARKPPALFRIVYQRLHHVALALRLEERLPLHRVPINIPIRKVRVLRFLFPPGERVYLVIESDVLSILIAKERSATGMSDRHLCRRSSAARPCRPLRLTRFSSALHALVRIPVNLIEAPTRNLPPQVRQRTGLADKRNADLQLKFANRP